MTNTQPFQIISRQEEENTEEYDYYELEMLMDENPPSIALCILSSVNVGVIKSDKELEDCTDLIVRFLDELIDWQQYPVKAAEVSTRARRSLGVGIMGLAHYLAKLDHSYEEQEAWDACHGLAESLQYYLLKASNQLAIEKGPCPYFHRTKYSQGILPIDTYKKDVDEICDQPLQHDWESLRKSIVENGLRNSTLTAVMPGESCLFWEHQVKTENGFMNFHQIAEYGNIDWKTIEDQELIGWHSLEKPISVETMDGNREVDKIYYNGNKEVATITFENGKMIKCTPNHRFLVNENSSLNDEPKYQWKRVHELVVNNKIVKFTGSSEESNTLSITSIQFTGELLPTYDIEVPEVHHYNCEGLVSHNSSLIINATNGIEPPRELLSVKRRLKQIVPQYSTLKNKYTLLWDMKSNKGYFNIVAVLQKFFDQAISANWSYNPEHYPDKKIPMSRIIEDWIYAYKVGHKTAYYQNTYDGKKEEVNLEELISDLESMEEDVCEACT